MHQLMNTQIPKKTLVLPSIFALALLALSAVPATFAQTSPGSNNPVTHCIAMNIANNPKMDGTFCTVTSMTAIPVGSAPGPLDSGSAFIITTCGTWHNFIGTLIWEECETGAWSSYGGLITNYVPTKWSKNYILAGWEDQSPSKNTLPQLPYTIEFDFSVAMYYWLPFPFQEWNYGGTVSCTITGYPTTYNAGCTFG